MTRFERVSSSTTMGLAMLYVLAVTFSPPTRIEAYVWCAVTLTWIGCYRIVARTRTLAAQLRDLRRTPTQRIEHAVISPGQPHRWDR